MRLEIQSPIETFEVTKVMRIQLLAFELLNQFRNGAALFTHEYAE
jgi:hypothetical protein